MVDDMAVRRPAEAIWIRIALVAALVGSVGGATAALAGRNPGMVRRPVVTDLSPAEEPSCRDVIAIVKRGWVCQQP
jgi:hypothetical protein